MRQYFHLLFVVVACSVASERKMHELKPIFKQYQRDFKVCKHRLQKSVMTPEYLISHLAWLGQMREDLALICSVYKAKYGVHTVKPLVDLHRLVTVNCKRYERIMQEDTSEFRR